MRREHKREVADAEDELEDCRVSAAKKVKLLELQLEQEHEERLGFLRERHEMEGRIMSLKDALEHGQDEEQVGGQGEVCQDVREQIQNPIRAAGSISLIF